MTREKAQLIVNELDAVLRRHGVQLAAECGNGPVQMYDSYAALDVDAEIEAAGIESMQSVGASHERKDGES